MRKNMSKVRIIKKPVSIITAFSESTAQDLLSIQAEYMLQQLNTVLLKSRALSQINSSKRAINNQFKYLEDLGNNLSEITGQEIDNLKLYKNKLIDIVDKNVKKVPLVSVSYRMTECDKISVMKVHSNYSTMNPSHMKRVTPAHTGEHHV